VFRLIHSGFHEAQGDVVVSLDGDLQHDPSDIPPLLAKINEGYHVASGWPRDRVDNPVTRKLPWRIANGLVAKASGKELHNFGTTLGCTDSLRFVF
jgi:glycosyltransferase involved in cell wall biosynthesis